MSGLGWIRTSRTTSAGELQSTCLPLAIYQPVYPTPESNWEPLDPKSSASAKLGQPGVWTERESNPRHQDFRSRALPAELSVQKRWRGYPPSYLSPPCRRLDHLDTSGETRTLNTRSLNPVPLPIGPPTCNGAGIRTLTNRIWNPALYQLELPRHMRAQGLEPRYEGFLDPLLYH